MTTDTIEREAKLFEAGSYPDRDIEITEDDLDRIVEGTSEAPIRVEHTATPFDGALGVLKGIYRRGKELFGKLCFTRQAWELVKSANARRLSVAIRKDKTAIAEVSLVREPRIADAAVFSEVDVVWMDQGELPLPTEAVLESSHPRRELVEQDIEHALDQFKREGKLVPASEVFARAILRSGDDSVITFADSPTPIAQVFRWFLESQPKVIEFGELAPAASGPIDEPEVFRKLGVTTEMVEKHRGR
jgi:hypothetical protein